MKGYKTPPKGENALQAPAMRTRGKREAVHHNGSRPKERNTETGTRRKPESASPEKAFILKEHEATRNTPPAPLLFICTYYLFTYYSNRFIYNETPLRCPKKRTQSKRFTIIFGKVGEKRDIFSHHTPISALFYMKVGGFFAFSSHFSTLKHRSLPL